MFVAQFFSIVKQKRLKRIITLDDETTEYGIVLQIATVYEKKRGKKKTVCESVVAVVRGCVYMMT